MAHPRNVRKFSEKIALHNQKQAEETAEFEKIMREVQGVTVKEPTDERTIQKSRSTEIFKRMAPSTPRETKCEGRQTGGPMRSKRKPEYSTSPYLSLPTDHNWRRSSSDSAIHQTLNHITSQEGLNVDESQMGSNAAINNRKTTNTAQTQNQSHVVYNIEMRPRSSSQITNCNFEPSAGSRLDAPTMITTGSLPDLSSLHGYPANPTPQTTNNYYYQNVDKSGFESIQSVRPDEAQQINSIKSSDLLDFQNLLNNDEFSQSICGDTKDKDLLSEYRHPHRPSPGSSPNLQGNLVNHFDQFDHSAPCSPTTHIKNNFQSVPDDTEGYYENSLKNNFEQFSLDDGLSSQYLDEVQLACSTFSGMDNATTLVNSSRNTYLENDGNHSTFNSTVPANSIPAIVLSDYSNDMTSNDIANGIHDMLGDSFELGQMDMVGLQMLSDPDIITDSFTEDTLRRDLNLN
ncbi:CREB-regulated transcription coactivator 2 isoform X2 [Culicoides brevitarsis]|uniref:CREB-regulated transcription coactivator 2 isoform X2 n=1 Tax=Culicoides brevitarsis TaxID=469753 RepID=UPI00307B296A